MYSLRAETWSSVTGAVVVILLPMALEATIAIAASRVADLVLRSTPPDATVLLTATLFMRDSVHIVVGYLLLLGGGLALGGVSIVGVSGLCVGLYNVKQTVDLLRLSMSRQRMGVGGRGAMWAQTAEAVGGVWPVVFYAALWGVIKTGARPTTFWWVELIPVVMAADAANAATICVYVSMGVARTPGLLVLLFHVAVIALDCVSSAATTQQQWSPIPATVATEHAVVSVQIDHDTHDALHAACQAGQPDQEWIQPSAFAACLHVLQNLKYTGLVFKRIAAATVSFTLALVVSAVLYHPRVHVNPSTIGVIVSGWALALLIGEPGVRVPVPHSKSGSVALAVVAVVYN